MPEIGKFNKKSPSQSPEKTFEELTFELLEYKEELNRSIREYEQAVQKMKNKDRIWTLVTLAILVLVGFILYTSVGGIRILIEHPDQVRPILWGCLGCLLLGFVVAHWLARLERRANFNEEVMRRRREKATVYYAELLQQLEEIRAKKAQGEKS